MKKDMKKDMKKLQFSKETIANLADRDLIHVAGGDSLTCESHRCPVW
jgi:natural product precursor